MRRYQIEWMLLGIALLILGALIGYWLYTERNRVEAQERDRLQVQARVIDENLVRQLEGANNALAWVRGDFPLPDNKSIAPEESRRLKAFADAMPGVSALLILDSKGVVLAANRDELIGMTFSQREYFNVARADPDPATLYVSKPFKTVRGVYSIIVARAVTGSRGEFAGLVSALLEPEYFNALLQSVLYAPDMSATLVHEDGRVLLFMPPDEQAAGVDLVKPGSFPSRYRESGQTATTFTGISRAVGKKRIMALRTVSPADIPMDKPLVVAVSRDLAAIYAPWRNYVMLGSGLYGVIALMAIVGLYFTQRRQRRLDRVEADHAKERRESAERQDLALRASEEKYRTVYESLQDIYVETALDGTILEISPQVETLSGGQYKRQDFLGKSAHVFYGDAERWAVFLRTLMELGSVKDFESTFRNRDGSVVPFSMSAVIRRDAEGKPGKIVSMIRDITVRKRAEESLRESEERLRAIFEGALDGILVADAGSGKFVAGNPAICRMLGYTLQEIVRVGVSDIHPRRDLPNVTEEFKRLRRGEIQKVADFPVLRKDGSTFHADMQLAPIRLGVTDCALVIVRDITERQRAEQEFRALSTELMMAEERERRELAQDLHDNLGQLLPAIKIKLASLEAGSLKSSIEEIEGLIDQAERSTRMVRLQLRPQILQFLGLGPALGWLAEEVERIYGLSVHIHDDSDPKLLKEPGRTMVFRAVRELLINVARHAQVKSAEIICLVDEGRLIVAVSDQGCGFDPAGTLGALQGAGGFGLFSIRERIAAIGGFMDIDSAPGEGSTITLTVPLSAGAMEERRGS